jgi:DNA-binding NarL/FixJ family response regulator
MDIDQKTKTRIGVCETQPVTIHGLRSMLENHAELEFCGSRTLLARAGELIAHAGADLLILDKTFGIQALLDWLAANSRATSEKAIVIWGTSLTEAEALRFLQSGARGIVRKNAEIESVLACLTSVVAGNTWMDDSVFNESPRQDRGSRSELTPREIQVMQLVEQGLKNREIGRELGIRPGTVKIHLKHIFEKTGVRGRYGLALNGLKHRGIVNPAELVSEEMVPVA